MNSKPNKAESAHMKRVKECCIENCKAPHLARGYCQNHYMQLRRSGSCLVAPLVPQTDMEFLSARVKRTMSGCWEWQMSIHQGYGKLIRKGRSWYAHIFSYVIHKGDVPDGLQINHACNNRACANPDHLYAGTQKENMSDMRKAGMENYLKGQENGNSKITESMARDIFLMSGFARVIAKKHDVSISLVYAIKKKRVWAHIHE